MIDISITPFASSVGRHAILICAAEAGLSLSPRLTRKLAFIYIVISDGLCVNCRESRMRNTLPLSAIYFPLTPSLLFLELPR